MTEFIIVKNLESPVSQYWNGVSWTRKRDQATRFRTFTRAKVWLKVINTPTAEIVTA